MNKIITTGYVALAATTALAMPNKQELERARPLVEAVTKADLAAYKAGEKTAQKIAAAHIAYAQKAEGEAAKYLLLQGAFKLYARSGEYDLAADTLDVMNRNIKDLPSEVIVEIVSDELRYVSDGKAPRLVAMLKEAKRKVVGNAQFQKVARRANTFEQTRQQVGKLFPGWSLDTPVQQQADANADSGFRANIRGQNNVLCLHPLSKDKPAVLSRTMTLPDRNPCLIFKVASCFENADFLLAVRVNGKDVLPNRLICTPDSFPWEDITVPLSSWRGSKVKLEIVVSANDWWYEFSFLSGIEIIEDRGSKVFLSDAKATVNGYTWSYRVDNGEATIIAEKDGNVTCAVSPAPVGQIVVPETLNGIKVTQIGRGAFEGCSKLESATIPAGVTRIRRGAFANCGGLMSVKIPQSVKSIDFFAFSDCVKLSSVTLPRGMKIISPGIFHGCKALKSVIIPKGVTDIVDWSAFGGCSGLEVVVIPEGVTNIGALVFSECRVLKAITIPSSVMSIGKNAFANCDELERIEMLGERPKASEDIFKNCSKLTEIHVPANAKSWAGMKDWQGKPLAFDNKATIDGYVWSYYVKDGEATIVTVRGVGADAMMSESKGHLTIPSSIAGVKVTGLGTHAFWVCREMKSVTIPDSVTRIYSLAFRDCRLKSVSILASVTNMEGVPFYANRDLTSFSVDASNPAYASVNGMLCTKDGALLLAGVNGDVEIPSCVTRISNHAFVDRSELTSVTIPSTVTNIGPCAFWNCHGLKSVTIPSGVACIEENAFRDCIGLTALTIQPNVKSINRCAFVGCHELTTVTILGERPNAEEDCRLFDNCPKLTAIRVSANAKSWAGMTEWQGRKLVFDAKAKWAESSRLERPMNRSLSGRPELCVAGGEASGAQPLSRRQKPVAKSQGRWLAVS